ncbi:MAG: hypothetical protein VXA39_17990 [Deltaproteobacteria bacterium]
MPSSITILVFAMNLQGKWVVINSLPPALEAAVTNHFRIAKRVVTGEQRSSGD